MIFLEGSIIVSVIKIEEREMVNNVKLRIDRNGRQYLENLSQ